MGIPVCNETKGNEIELDKKRQQQLKKDLTHFKKKFKKNNSIPQQNP
tara:strand:+ start:479 stop:619 length:141 start_codon:yes stop_codon:yes gene_type:complete